MNLHLFCRLALWVCGLPLALAVAAGAPPEIERLAIWCEFMPYQEVEPCLDTLARHGCDLILHIEKDSLGRADLKKLLRAAQHKGVAVDAWLLLPYEEHLYVGEASLHTTRQFALALADWIRQEQLGIKTFVFDCEPSPLLGRELFACVRQGRLGALLDLLRQEAAPLQFTQSLAGINALIADLRRRGFQVDGAGNRIFLDFLHRQNVLLEDSMNAPFTMVDWDHLSFITYRYQASQVAYVAMINRYAALAEKYFPGRVALDLGLLGDHRDIPENARRAELFGGGEFFRDYLAGMRSTLDLQQTMDAALAQGLRRFNLYSLDGAVTSVAGLELWLQAARAARPASKLEAWTPYQSVKLAALSALLEKTFRLFIGTSKPEQQKDQNADEHDARIPARTAGTFFSQRLAPPP